MRNKALDWRLQTKRHTYQVAIILEANKKSGFDELLNDAVNLIEQLNDCEQPNYDGAKLKASGNLFVLFFAPFLSIKTTIHDAMKFATVHPIVYITKNMN